MATLVDDTLYLPIGCSCISQFQLNFKFGTDKYQSQLFDWSITAPDSTIKILEDKQLFIRDLEDIDVFKKNMIRSKQMPGYLVWHLDKMLPYEVLPITERAELSPYAGLIVEKHRHQINKIFDIQNVNVHCIWSNIQPNLKMAVEGAGFDFSDFILTKLRYHKIKAAAAAAWNNSTVTFVARLSDLDEGLIENPDVVVIDLVRSNEYKGEANLYSPVFERIQSGKKAH